MFQKKLHEEDSKRLLGTTLYQHIPKLDDIEKFLEKHVLRN